MSSPIYDGAEQTPIKVMTGEIIFQHNSVFVISGPIN